MKVYFMKYVFGIINCMDITLERFIACRGVLQALASLALEIWISISARRLAFGVRSICIWAIEIKWSFPLTIADAQYTFHLYLMSFICLYSPTHYSFIQLSILASRLSPFSPPNLTASKDDDHPKEEYIEEDLLFMIRFRKSLIIARE